ncbi:MAG TPA: tyrosine-type recombinase/integrase [Candidatus Binataceae bacterium]
MRSADWVRLTNRLAEGAKPSSREQFLRDGELKGFGLRVARSGLKTFFLEFRSPVDRRFRRLKLGRYPDLSVDAARTLAKKAKGDTYAQRDPAAERVQLRQRASGEMTLETLCGRFISEYAERHRRSWKRDKARFDLAGAVYKDLWKRRISEIIPADLVALHNKITASNGPVTANRTVEAIRTAWNWTRSMRHHAVTENPADAVRRNREYSRERYLRPNEIVALLEALRAEQRRHWRDFFTLVLTLGCRKGELLTARWEDFDFETAIWTLPGGRGKSEKPKVLPLTEGVIEMLRKLPSLEKSEFLFPAPRQRSGSGHMQEPKKAWREILARAKIRDLTIHDLRRTFGTHLGLLGAPTSVIGRALGHTGNSRATLIYTRAELEPVRQALTRYEQSMGLLKSG